AIGLNAGRLTELWPGPGNIARRLDTLRNNQTKLRQIFESEAVLYRPILAVKNQPQAYWLPKRDGDPQFAVRQRVEIAARQAGIKLKTMGSLQTGKIVAGIKTYEMNIVANAQIGEIARMMGELAHGLPQLYLENLSLNPDNLHHPRYVVFNATVKAVAIVEPEIEAVFWPPQTDRDRERQQISSSVPHASTAGDKRNNVTDAGKEK
ncbi:MAG: hypothetical protein PHQ27_09535, partial [Victivallales bacterium]|nr:hypothetical protein [Victivallales bacterium]